MTDTALNTEVTKINKTPVLKEYSPSGSWICLHSLTWHQLRVCYMPATIPGFGDTKMYKWGTCFQRTYGLFGRDREEGKTKKPKNKATYMLEQTGVRELSIVPWGDRFVQGSLYGRDDTWTEIWKLRKCFRGRTGGGKNSIRHYTTGEYGSLGYSNQLKTILDNV